MSNILTLQTLETMGIKSAVLVIDGYALPVHFRICRSNVECSVPSWCGISDLPEKIEEVLLVFLKNSNTDLSWIFLRGAGKIVKTQDWDGLLPSEHSLVCPEDLYHILHIEPTRMELFDETRGWGFRETTDFIISSEKSETGES